MKCFRKGGCGPYENYICRNCPANNENYLNPKYKRGDRVVFDFLRKDKAINDENYTIRAIREIYRWLYHNGILKEISIEYKEYEEVVYFVFDILDLMKYKEEMINSGINNVYLAINSIFYDSKTPCIYSGLIQLTGIMSTYRDNYGCIGKSWECDLVKGLYLSEAHKVLKEFKKNGAYSSAAYLFKYFK